MATASTTFHGFTKLPQELRDDIWRECLPRRVLEIDIPYDYTLAIPDRLSSTSRVDDGPPGVRPPRLRCFDGCFMRQTSKINAAPPVISRVCRESRRVTFETGVLLKHGSVPRAHGDPDIGYRVRTQWFDRARDTVVHLHYNMLRDAYTDHTSVTGNPIQVLRDAVPLTAGVRSISYDFLSHHNKREWKASREMLQGMRKVSVCLKVVCIHVATEPAIQSGLFGVLGEERVAMSHALDYERVGRFRDLWEKHGSAPDIVTDNSFKLIAESRLIPNGFTIQEWLEEIKTRWVRDSWYDMVESSEPGQSPGSSWRQINVPGLLKKEVWLKAPKHRYRVAAHSMCQGRWIPNRGHPWVKEAYLNVPEFIPTIMFRLCTNQYFKFEGHWSSKPV